MRRTPTAEGRVRDRIARKHAWRAVQAHRGPLRAGTHVGVFTQGCLKRSPLR